MVTIAGSEYEVKQISDADFYRWSEFCLNGANSLTKLDYLRRATSLNGVKLLCKLLDIDINVTEDNRIDLYFLLRDYLLENKEVRIDMMSTSGQQQYWDLMEKKRARQRSRDSEQDQ